MSERLKKLLAKARTVKMSPEQRESQRQSFAYGNTKFENDRITRDTVERASRNLSERNAGKSE